MGKAILDVQGVTATITLSNPDRRNAIDLSLAQELADHADTLSVGTDASVIVLQGHGERAYCSGIDVKFADSTGDRAAAFAEIDQHLDRAAMAFDRCPIPIIALLRGACIGGGLIVAAWADLRIGSSDLNLYVPALANRLIYPRDSLRRLERVIGLTHLKRLFYEGKPVEPQTLLDWSMIDYLVPAEDFRAEANRIIESIAAQPRDMLTAYKTHFAELKTKT